MSVKRFAPHSLNSLSERQDYISPCWQLGQIHIFCLVDNKKLLNRFNGKLFLKLNLKPKRRANRAVEHTLTTEIQA
jgi:hypothetical protein